MGYPKGIIVADIQISLHDIQEYKTLSIDGVGEFKVRKLSAPESLDLQAKERRAAIIVSEMYATGINKFKGKTDEELTEADHAEIEIIKKKLEKYGEEIDEIKAYKQKVNMSRFEDVNGGDAVEKLFATLSDEGIDKIFTAVFADHKIDAKDEAK